MIGEVVKILTPGIFYGLIGEVIDEDTARYRGNGEPSSDLIFVNISGGAWRVPFTPSEVEVVS